MITLSGPGLIADPAPAVPAADDAASADTFASHLDAATSRTPDAPTRPAPETPGARGDAEGSTPTGGATLTPSAVAAILGAAVILPGTAAESESPTEGDGADATSPDLAVPELGSPGLASDALAGDSRPVATSADGADGAPTGAQLTGAPSTAAQSTAAQSTVAPTLDAQTPSSDLALADSSSSPSALADAEGRGPLSSLAGIASAADDEAMPGSRDGTPGDADQAGSVPGALSALGRVGTAAETAPRAGTAAEPASAAATPAPSAVSAAPVPVPAPGVGAPAPVAASTPASAPALVEQMRAPVAALRALPDGAHVVTVHITPDELGPVTVRAVVTGGALDVQLTAATDAAREALRAILPDLRRDLAGGGAPAQLQLSDAVTDRSANDRGSARDTDSDAAHGGTGRGTDGPRATTEGSAPAPGSDPRLGHTALDVLA